MSAIHEFELCPFCHCSKVKIEEERGRISGEDWFFVECQFCGAQGPTSDSRDQAVSRWNERHSSDENFLQAIHMLSQIVARNMASVNDIICLVEQYGAACKDAAHPSPYVSGLAREKAYAAKTKIVADLSALALFVAVAAEQTELNHFVAMKGKLMASPKYKMKNLGHKRTPTKAVIRVVFQNSEKFDVPAQIVADSRDEHYKDDKEDTIGFIRKGSLDDYDLIDWANNNMNWSDVSEFATKVIEDDEPHDYEGDYPNSEKKIVGTL